MSLKPLPYERPSESPAKTCLRNKPFSKLRSRAQQHLPAEDSNSITHKLLQKSCVKILNYIGNKGKKGIDKINELEILLQRSIMALHKEKRRLSDKKSKS